MKREIPSVVSQVPGVGGESRRPFPIPSAPETDVHDDITQANAGGGANCVCVCLMCLSVGCRVE